MNIFIYEPPLCCSTGVCGPEPDKQLIDLQNMINALLKKGIAVKRFSINQQPFEFTKNEIIRNIIKEKGVRVLPVTLVEDSILKTEKYPTIGDFKNLIPDLNLEMLDEIIIQ